MPDKPKYDSKDVKSHFKMAESKPSILDLLDNTTANHGSHVFDHRCDICMGKAAPSLPPPPPPPPTSLQPPSPLTPPPPPLQTDTSNASTPDRLVLSVSYEGVSVSREGASVFTYFVCLSQWFYLTYLHSSVPVTSEDNVQDTPEPRYMLCLWFPLSSGFFLQVPRPQHGADLARLHHDAPVTQVQRVRLQSIGSGRWSE